MLYADTLAGSWTVLAERLDAADTLRRWAVAEPGLGSAGTVADLRRLTRPGCDPGWADRLLGAVVRLAAVDGGADDDALLVALHLLGEQVLVLAQDLATLAPDMLGLVVSQLSVQIRTYPWRRLRRAFAANLYYQTRRALLAELAASHRQPPETLCAGVPDRAVPGVDDEGELDVVELLVWAVRSGVRNRDVQLLVAAETMRAAQPEISSPELAARLGLARSTFFYQQAKAREAVRAAAGSYLSAVA